MLASLDSLDLQFGQQALQRTLLELSNRPEGTVDLSLAVKAHNVRKNNVGNFRTRGLDGVGRDLEEYKRAAGRRRSPA